MNECELPDTDSIVRYLRPTWVDDRDNLILGLKAFSLREDELSLSVQWVCVFEGTLDEKIQAVRETIHFRLGTGGAFAQLRILNMKKSLAREGHKNIRVINKPNSATDKHPWCDPSHSEVEGYPKFEKELQQRHLHEIMVSCIEKVHPGKIDG